MAYATAIRSATINLLNALIVLKRWFLLDKLGDFGIIGYAEALMKRADHVILAIESPPKNSGKKSCG